MPLTLMYALVGTGLLFAALGVPLALRRIKRNPYYGLRMKKTMSSDRRWYDANAVAGLGIFIAGIIQAVATAVLYVVCLPASGAAMFISACSMTVVGVWTVCLIAVMSYVDTLK